VLTYRDPSGRSLAPKLTPPPLDGPDVTIRAARALQTAEGKAAGARLVLDRRGRRWVLGNQGRVHMLMAAHSMNKIETIYATIFEGILGEKISTKPVEIVTPFPWLKTARQGRIAVNVGKRNPLGSGILTRSLTVVARHYSVPFCLTQNR
ncbi:MAG: hypothetical protein ACRELG_25565, partial [Gemmataceae bacterium]